MSAPQVAVIGAGVVGTICAIEALRSGHSVTLIDAETPGGRHAPSYGNGTWITSHSVLPPSEPGAWKKVPGYLFDPLGPLAIRWRHLPQAAPWLLAYLRAGATHERVERIAVGLRALLVGAIDLHAVLAREAGVPQLIDKSGLLHCFRHAGDFAASGWAWELRRRLGVRWDELGEAELRECEPDLGTDYRFGVLVREGGYCRDPGAYVSGLFRHALDRGARWVRGAATGFDIASGRLKAVRLGEAKVDCDVAIVAAGLGSRRLAAALGDELPLQAERGYHVSLKNCRVGPRRPMMSADKKVVIAMTEAGLRIAGQVEVAAADAPPDWRRAEVLRKQLFALFPVLGAAVPPFDAQDVWMGSRPSMPDGCPCIGHASAAPDVIYAFGHGHIGLSASARTGQAAARLVAGEREAWLDPFDPKRFKRT